MAENFPPYFQVPIQETKGHSRLATQLMKLSGLRVKPPKEAFPGGAVVKNPPANAGNTGSGPGPGRPHMPQSN